MLTSVNTTNNPVLYAIHPLYDAPEEKRTADGLDKIHMSKSVKASLITLRVYLILILCLSLYRLTDLLGLFGHHAAKLG